MGAKSAIMASKMFKSSPRKKRILAALEDPINKELLVQLDEYLDDEYKGLTNAPTPEEDAQRVDDTEQEESGKPMQKFEDTRGARPNRREPMPFTENPTGEFDLVETEVEDESDETQDRGTVENSTSVNGSPIKASFSGGIVDGFSYEAQINNLAAELKGSLNARQDTAGVTRVRVKDDEIWMYYGDSVNLNTVLPNVIDLLNAACYNYVQFNRLARTDNAIVFTLEFNDTAGDVKPSQK